MELLAAGWRWLGYLRTALRQPWAAGGRRAAGQCLVSTVPVAAADRVVRWPGMGHVDQWDRRTMQHHWSTGRLRDGPGAAASERLAGGFRVGAQRRDRPIRPSALRRFPHVHRQQRSRHGLVAGALEQWGAGGAAEDIDAEFATPAARRHVARGGRDARCRASGATRRGDRGACLSSIGIAGCASVVAHSEISSGQRFVATHEQRLCIGGRRGR
mmetsp:Transcript_125224/g.401174  ORF Transcript_125224/g.401174 Transcript_125224/m.401174 type:complete len:214 (+) Transcript_125224:610-1251(+)